MAGLTLDGLNQLGGLVSRDPVLKDVKWRGETYTIWVRILGAGEAEELFRPNKDKKSQMCRLISSCVLLGEGDARTPLTYEQAYRLDPILSKAFVDAINEANDTGNDSAPTKNSGTN